MSQDNRWAHRLPVLVSVLALSLPGKTSAQLSRDTILTRLDSVEAQVVALRTAVLALTEDHPSLPSAGRHLRWGLPAGGQFLPEDEPDTLLDKEFFIISYDEQWRIPEWVAYHLSPALLGGTTNRTNDFRADPVLRDERAELRDFRGSGFDRGHMAPAAAFKRSRRAMSTTFLLSNMTPQTARLNRRIWRELEEEVRRFVNERGDTWVITGSVFMAADSTAILPTRFIGPNRIAVPTHFYKVLLTAHDSGTFDMVAFLLPNRSQSIRGDPADFVVSVDFLENITGHDFFGLVPDPTEAILESALGSWPF